jgi:hypothetical protein
VVERRWWLVVGAGLLLGVAATVADELIGERWFGIDFYDAQWAASRVLNSASVWAALGMCAGWLLGRPRRAALGGAVVLCAALVGYYVPRLIRSGAFSHAAGGRSWDYIAHWTAAALLLGPLLGLVGSAMRRNDVVGWLACTALPLGTGYDVLGHGHLRWARFRLEPVLSTVHLGMLIGAVLVAALAAAGARRGSRDPAGPGNGRSRTTSLRTERAST